MLYVSTYFVFLFTLQLLSILKETPLAWLWLLLWGVLFVFLCKFYRRLLYPQDHPHVHYRKRVILSFFAVLFFLICSHVYFQYDVRSHSHSQISAALSEEGMTIDRSFEAEVQVGGQIISPVDMDGNRIRFTLAVDSIEQQVLSKPEKMVLTRYADTLEEREMYNSLERGDLWSGMVRPAKPQTARNPGAFDYQQYLYRQGIHVVGQVTDQEWTVREKEGGLHSVLHVLDDQRQVWLDQIEQLFSEEISPIVQAMTMGDREGIQADLMEMYQDLGVIHLLAISGLHIGIILGLLYFCLGLLPTTRETKYALMLGFIPVYIYLSGAPVSVVRAGLMAMVVLVALRFQWGRHSLLGLYVVYLLTLVYDPYQLYHVGYQLSFGVTFGLIAIYPSIRKLFSILPERVQSIVGIALVAQVVSLPVILFHFYQFSPLSLFLNVFLVPLYSVFYIPAAFLITLFSFVHSDMVRLPVWVYEHSLQWIHGGLEWLHSFPWSTVHTGLPGMWWFGVYFLILLLWIVFSELNKRIRAWICLGCISFVLALPVLLPYLDHRAHIMMLDVGQAEAIVVELPYREEVILIDVGDELRFEQEDWQVRQNAFETGKDVILPYLRYRGIQKIDKVLFSHGHYDHIAGMKGLLGKISVDSVLRSPVTPQSAAETELLDQIAEHGIPIYLLGRADEWHTENTSFHVLFPERQAKLVEHVQHIHDHNMVLWNQIYQTTFLWTGDVEEDGERQIIREYPHLEVDVLKIAHHGSDTSTTDRWLEQIQPDVGLISTGENNLYGHPHPDVMERLQDAGVTVLRTDLHGGIHVTVSPEQVVVRPTLQTGKESIY